MSVLVLAVALASPLGVDVNAHAGVGLRNQSTGDGVGVAFAYGAGVGYDLGRWIGELPVRAEIAFQSDTFGGGRGTDAVDVSTWQGELLALVGLDWVAVRWTTDAGLRLQLLGGGGLRLQWVNIRVLDEDDSTWSAAGLGGLVAGALVDLGPASVGVRAMWGAPRPRLTQIYVTGAWRF